MLCVCTQTTAGRQRRQLMRLALQQSVRHGWIVIAIAISACQEPTAVGDVPSAAMPDIAAAVASHGFQTEGMQDAGDYVIVEGDIALSKASLFQTSPDTARAGTLRPGPARRQWMVDTSVSQTNATSIVVD